MIGVIGVGVVGTAVLKAFSNVEETIGYDVRGEYSDEKNLENIVANARIAFICVPSPTIDGKQDLSALHGALRELDKRHYSGVVCIKCTVLPGTCDALVQQYLLKIVHNPEFLTAAKPYEDFMAQKEVLLSGKNADCMEVIHLYRALLSFTTPLRMFENYRITELAKYYSNCFLAIKVTFANEMYELCQATGTEYNAVRDSAVAQGLIGMNHTNVPGPDGKFGYALGCLPKETLALESFCIENGLSHDVLSAAIVGNRRRRQFDNKCTEINEKPIVI